jgi:hypothetical protein
MGVTVSFIVPTIGRDTLVRSLGSIMCQIHRGDEVLVCGDVSLVDRQALAVLGECLPVRHLPCPRSNRWGGPERRMGIARASGHYLAFLDDDDIYLPHARACMADAAVRTPGRPVLFRMRDAATGDIKWKDLAPEPCLKNGNVGSPMIFIPNVPAKLGYWTDRYCGDFQFLNSMKWSKYERRRNSLVFRPEIVAITRPFEATIADAWRRHGYPEAADRDSRRDPPGGAEAAAGSAH